MGRELRPACHYYLEDGGKLLEVTMGEADEVKEMALFNLEDEKES